MVRCNANQEIVMHFQQGWECENTKVRLIVWCDEERGHKGNHKGTARTPLLEWPQSKQRRKKR